MRNLTLVFWISLLLPGLAMGHTDHSPGIGSVNPGAWPQYLNDFRQFSRVADLESAKKIARAIGQKRMTNEQLYLAAQTAQADHRFNDALNFLDRLLVRSPNFDGARLMRANTLITLGREEMALQDCNSLRSMPLSVILACRLMSGGADGVYTKLVQVVEAETPRLSTTLRAWVLATLGDYLLRQGEYDSAADHFLGAYSLDQLVSYQISRVDAYLRNNRCKEALSTTSRFRHVLAMQVKHAIAGRQCAVPDHKLETVLAILFEHDIEHEDFSHGREMAEFHLFVADNVALARKILTQSLKNQRTFEDERLWLIANAQ
ncbi:MAG: hypothetical protein AAF542_24600 [Pseudomonadota bacterium]